MKKYIKIVLVFFLLFVIFLKLYYFLSFEYKMIQEKTDNIKVEEKVVYLDSLTLRQKLAQMIMIRGDGGDLDILDLNVGGVFLDKQETEQEYKEKIKGFQENSKVKLLVATDLEGAWTPFRENTDRFPYFSEINSSKQAYDVGLGHGKILMDLGFNLNFAPVAELSDKAYGGRAFSGTREEIKDKLGAYIKGLQSRVYGTCKHYPGKTLETNLHFHTDKQTISKEDLELFEHCIDKGISAIMVSHVIAEGELDSLGKPSSVSEEVISSLPNDVLIISDEVNMQGLKRFYYLNKRGMYRDLINAGNNLILDFKLDKRGAYKLLIQLEKDVEDGKIDKSKIDESVKKILELKGYEVR